MFPTFELFGRTLGLYSIMAMLGALSAGFWAMRAAKKRGHDDNDMLMLLLMAAIGVVVGGHLLYALLNARAVFAWLVQRGGTDSFATLLYFAESLFGGSVFYGGLLGGLGAGVLYARHKKLPLGEYADIAAPAIPLFHTFGRVGCFLGGCCYGVPWPGGVTFHRALIESANGVARFPVQLVEAAFNLLLFLVLAWLLQTGRARGRLLPVYLLAYAGGRFLLEFLRGDAYRGFFLGLSTSQWISILVFGGAAACLARRVRRQARKAA